MKFTLVFAGTEASAQAVGLAFMPGPCWLRCGDEVGNLLVNMSDQPHFRLGSVERLLAVRPDLAPARPAAPVVVVAHPIGHGSERDLELLLEDLANSGFTPVAVRP